MIIRLYKMLLCLYPQWFRGEFGEEMLAVFADALANCSGVWASVRPFLRELRDLPGALINAYQATLFEGGKMSVENKFISKSTPTQAAFGLLPFLAYGIVVLISNRFQLRIPQGVYLDFSFYLLALIGLLIGWLRGFPLWSYSYLGWALVFAWSWTNMHTGGFELFGYVFTRQEAWGYRIWIPFGVTILIALIWTRSLNSIKKFFTDIWNDWSRLILTSFTLGSWMLLIYDENHHPWLMLFILGSALITSAGVWFFLRSARLIGRVFSIIGSFLGAAILGGISYATWDWRAYYGLPPSDRLINNLGFSIIGVFLWLLILFWPALIGALHGVTRKRQSN